MAVKDQVITDEYALYNGDCCEMVQSLADDSIHMSIYSPPFAVDNAAGTSAGAGGGSCLYNYSSSDRDFSNSRTYTEFFEHYEFLVKQIHRITLPGRITAVHCTDIPVGGANICGYSDFPGDIIRLHQRLGFDYLPRICIWKEPLAVRNRTMAKSLAHRQITEDSTLTNVACGDYLIPFRKRGTNPIPVTHETGFSKYVGERVVPADLLRLRNFKGKQTLNRYSHWIWRHYACHSSDTEVLTRAGWKLHKDVSLQDHVCCFNLETSSQEWHHPQHVHEYQFTGEMVRINGGKNSPLDVLVTPNHRMVVQPNYPLPVGSRKPHKNPRHWAFREAGTLSTSKWKVPFAVGGDLTGNGGHADFARFLGWWISEGSLAYDAPVLTQNVGALADRMKATVTALGYESRCIIQDGSHRGRQKCMHLRLKGATKLGRWLREQCGGKCGVKCIPSFVFGWSIQYRRMLLEALIDGDGTRLTERRSVYCTTSKQLADDVQRLAISLGQSGRIRNRVGQTKNSAAFTYYVEIGDRKHVTIQPRNFEKVQYSGNVYCLTVPTSAYVTRRNGKMAVTGNSCFWDDIRIDRVLKYREAKEDGDERHQHPLQLDVLERGIEMWTNPGEKVFDPFDGVGSTVYSAVINGRKGIGCELKRSYFLQSVRNLAKANQPEESQADLLSDIESLEPITDEIE